MGYELIPMEKPRPVMVHGLLGSEKDAGVNAARWLRWRPTVAICQQPGLAVAHFRLLYQPRFEALFEVVRRDIEKVSPSTRVEGVPIDLADPWDFEEVYEALHAYCRPWRDDDAHDHLVHITTGTHVCQICWYLLTESRHLPGRLVQTSPPPAATKRDPGAALGKHRVIDLDLSRYDRIASRFQREREGALDALKGGIATRNARFNALIERVERVAARSPDPILLLGPTGSGKSQLARRIHALKHARRQVTGAFVDVNCATLRGDAAMSTLFGHVKGAFTGATTDRPGLLRKADQGVLFLDEVGELGLDEQAMLLRALEERVFYPMGSDKEAGSAFQLVAGTNRDLAARVTEGRFREDLLARISLWTFTLPGLRERPEDVEPNLDHELARASEALSQQVSFNREARARFVDFATGPEALWRGNFRDFGASVHRMATLSLGRRIDVATVDDEVARLKAQWRAFDRPSGAAEPRVRAALGERAADVDRFDRVQLEDVLSVCAESASLSAAGRALFEASRARKTSVNDADRLRKYLARFGLAWGDVSER